MNTPTSNHLDPVLKELDQYLTEKRMIALELAYRGIPVEKKGNQYFIDDGSGKTYPFDTYGEACGFIDTWYIMQALVAN